MQSFEDSIENKLNIVRSCAERGILYDYLFLYGAFEFLEQKPRKNGIINRYVQEGNLDFLEEMYIKNKNILAKDSEFLFLFELTKYSC